MSDLRRRVRIALALCALVGGFGGSTKAAPAALTPATPAISATATISGGSPAFGPAGAGGAISNELRAVPPDGATESPSKAVSDTFAIVPESGVLVMLGIGLTAFGAARRRKKQ